jgi:hypothetical protein
MSRVIAGGGVKFLHERVVAGHFAAADFQPHFGCGEDDHGGILRYAVVKTALVVCEAQVIYTRFAATDFKLDDGLQSFSGLRVEGEGHAFEGLAKGQVFGNVHGRFLFVALIALRFLQKRQRIGFGKLALIGVNQISSGG